LFAQQARFAEYAARTGAPLPALAPTPVEIAAAATALGDLSPAAVGQAMRSAHATLDAADSALAVPSRAVPSRAVPSRATRRRRSRWGARVGGVSARCAADVAQRSHLWRLRPARRRHPGHP